MAFWSTADSEPKRKFRWQVAFAANSGGISGLTYALKKVDKPKGKVNSTTHKYLNHNFNYPGRWEWEDINMTIASVTRDDATYLINQVLINAGYGVPSSIGSSAELKQRSTIGKLKFNGALGAYLNIQQLNPDGVIIEDWRVVNPFFTSVNYGDLDYSSEDIVDITVGVKYDYAKLLTGIDDGGPDGTAPVNPGFP